MPTDLIKMRIGEKLRIDSGAKKQDGRPGFLGTANWSIDDASPSVAGDPATVHAVVSSSAATPTVITTANAHGFVTGDKVVISGHTGATPDSVNSDFYITKLSPTTFALYAAYPPSSPLAISIGGTGGSVHRLNALIEPRNDGAPPRGYDADITGLVSGNGLLRLVADNGMPGGGALLDSKPFTILNASSFSFKSGPNNYINSSGVLILDFNDSTGPNAGNPITITATPIDVRGVPTEEPFVEYTVSSWAWSDPSGHLSVTPSSGTVDVYGSTGGDGLLLVTALNSSGDVVSGSLPYRVLATASLSLASI